MRVSEGRGGQRGQLLEGGDLIDGDKLQMSLNWASGLASTETGTEGPRLVQVISCCELALPAGSRQLPNRQCRASSARYCRPARQEQP